ncbi:MAG: bifunctional diaminohydroxyphosphoribosylaminopyrimidine deaminase/5-amino-6-(5-phosphoribosylamino)uracil reductase RibD, partial [Bacteroidota bacterium]
MRRTLELASMGQGKVSPNPLVGAVIVWNQKIIGEGWHNKYGEAHAEVNAIQSVTDPTLLSESSIYVNLEPCSHHGKTPPCADLLIKHQFKKVCIAHMDPNPLVAGNGVAKLQEAGIEVELGILEEEAQYLNRRFLRFMKDQRPYVIFKWAETADGFMARENFDSKWISNLLSRKLVHKWRAEEDGIMVGKNTARWDNPKLTVRDWSGKNPIRIVIDRQLELSPSLHLFDQQTPTICYNLLKNEEKNNL